MKLIFLVLASFVISNSFGQKMPELRYADKVRIREAMTISSKYGDKLFKGYSKAPFAIVLVADSTEFLINHPAPSPDFTSLGHDDILNTTIYFRKRQFAPNLLATFPAVNGLSCIVAGTPETTNRSSTDWVITLLHEHFHQYQASYPGYYKSVADLNLSGGDQTGMWMLNYPFPYDSTPVTAQYEMYKSALYKTIQAFNKKEFKSNLTEYFTERGKLKKLLTEADYRYLSFQIWQEGLARNTEFSILTLIDSYSPSKEMLELPDFISFPEFKLKMYQKETENLFHNKLSEMRRVCFYSAGFAEGILLDKLNRSWRKKYLRDKFYIEHYSKKYK